ncbi:MAG: hypothetical protein ABI960_05125 [Candidatus Eisenbacteria bacterium]
MSRFTIRWEPAGFAYRARAERALREVARGLGLTRRLGRVIVRVRPSIATDEAVVAWREGRRVALRIDLDLGNFLTADGRRALARSGLGHADVPARRYSDRTARTAFLHELSHVADALRHGIDSNDVPRGRWAPFNEAWNVWIDGRLTRRGEPALTKGERWAAFRHTFARRGRPRVWSRLVFDRLWRAETLSQRDLLDAVELLVG